MCSTDEEVMTMVCVTATVHSVEYYVLSYTVYNVVVFGTATVHSVEYYGLWYCHSTQCRVLWFMVLPQYTV
jgi:hypothetical protein